MLAEMYADLNIVYLTSATPAKLDKKVVLKENIHFLDMSNSVRRFYMHC